MKLADGTTIPECVSMGTPKFAAAVPSDSTVLTGVRAVYCVTAGTIQVKNHLDVTVSIAMVAGQTIPISPAKVMAATTGTYVLLF